MSSFKPIVLTIAGFDPCGGAGLIADCKTVEQLGGYCMGVLSSNTIQTEDSFTENHWTPKEQVLGQVDAIINRYPIAACKVGIIESFELLLQLVQRVRKLHPKAPIVWDPVLSASTGFVFHACTMPNIGSLLSSITLVTPNAPEAKILFDTSHLGNVSNHTGCAILLKGGHSSGAMVTDTLYKGDSSVEFTVRRSEFKKHGTGCILSAAIATHLAKGSSLAHACGLAQEYVSTYINSHPSLLGYHIASGSNHHIND